MEDVREQHAKRPVISSRRWVSVGLWLILGLNVFGLAGCSLFVLAGKMFFGDPEQAAAFQNATGVDLTEGDKKVVVLCSAPSLVEGGELSVNYEIVEEVSRQLKRRGVNLISSNDVRTWMDDNGGRLDDPRDLAEDFEVDYIIYISLARVTFREENSPSLYRGVANGEVFAYEVHKKTANPWSTKSSPKASARPIPKATPGTRSTRSGSSRKKSWNAPPTKSPTCSTATNSAKRFSSRFSVFSIGH